MEDLKTEAATARSRITDTVNEMSEAATDNVRRVTRNVTDGMQRAADYVRGNDLQKISADVLDYAKSNPAQALIGAAIAGFVVGRLISSRRV
jgi:ElaB/YqjD/DUF883 family membrane-anchored ribosome-binding protein